MYRIVQEALTNAPSTGKQSAPSSKCRRTKATSRVSVRDDGDGFDSERRDERLRVARNARARATARRARCGSPPRPDVARRSRRTSRASAYRGKTRARSPPSGVQGHICRRRRGVTSLRDFLTGRNVRRSRPAAHRAAQEVQCGPRAGRSRPRRGELSRRTPRRCSNSARVEQLRLGERICQAPPRRCWRPAAPPSRRSARRGGVHRGDAEARREHAVVGRGRASALHVPEDRGARLIAGARLDLACQLRADAAEARVAELVRGLASSRSAMAVPSRGVAPSETTTIEKVTPRVVAAAQTLAQLRRCRTGARAPGSRRRRPRCPA